MMIDSTISMPTYHGRRRQVHPSSAFISYGCERTIGMLLSLIISAACQTEGAQGRPEAISKASIDAVASDWERTQVEHTAVAYEAFAVRHPGDQRVPEATFLARLVARGKTVELVHPLGCTLVSIDEKEVRVTFDSLLSCEGMAVMTLGESPASSVAYVPGELTAGERCVAFVGTENRGIGGTIAWDCSLIGVRAAEPAPPLLHSLIGDGKMEEFRSALRAGHSLGVHDYLGRTPFLLAAELGASGEILDEILKLGVSVDEPMPDGRTALALAVGAGRSGTVQCLLDHGASASVVLMDGDGMIHLAARGTDANLVKTLVASGADVNGRGRNEVTPLQNACFAGNVTTVRTLLEAGADPNAHSKNSYSPLELALRKKHDEVVQLLTAHGAR